MPVKFADVQTILKSAVEGWSKANGGVQPQLPQVHHDAHFGWDTKQQLLNATARGFRLIQPELIGTPDKQGKNANLVKALRDASGVNNNGQMPDGGPFLALNPDIQTIIDWIDGGCPD